MSKSDALRELWAKRVKRWRESGLNGREYADAYGFGYATLRHWQQRLERPESVMVPTATEVRHCEGADCCNFFLPIRQTRRYCGRDCKRQADYQRERARKGLGPSVTVDP